MERINVTVPKFPATELELARINVFLGANGTGKSQLLKEFKDKASFPDRNIVYVEGGRTISIPNSVALDRNNFNEHSTVKKSLTTYGGKRKNTLVERVKDALILLDRQGDEIGIRHSEAVVEWQKGGSLENCPERERAPLDLLFEQFHSIFPTIELGFQPESKNLHCKKNGSPAYAPNDLSDGEKQVLSILADILHLADNNSLIIVDEPELNLNASLALRLWETIESDLDGAMFIYATHNIGFAKRTNVDSLYVLGKNEEHISKINDITEIDDVTANALLGTIPAILSNSSVLVVEGQDDSFDFPFYQWLLDGIEIGIVPIQGSHDVKAVTSRAGVWDQIAVGIKLRGIIDRDYKPKGEITDFSGSNCLVLDYHEVESYFCHPDLIAILSTRLGVNELSVDDVKNMLLNEFSSSMLSIAVQRVVAQTSLRLGVSIEKQVLARISDEKKLKTILCQRAKEEIKKASLIDADNVMTLFQKEISNCKKALEEKDIETILVLLPAKNLIEKIAKKMGLNNKLLLLKAVKKHIRLEEFDHLSNLQTAVKGLFVTTGTMQKKRQEGLGIEQENIPSEVDLAVAEKLLT